jgi:hypothetical protein
MKDLIIPSASWQSDVTTRFHSPRRARLQSGKVAVCCVYVQGRASGAGAMVSRVARGHVDPPQGLAERSPPPVWGVAGLLASPIVRTFNRPPQAERTEARR